MMTRDSSAPKLAPEHRADSPGAHVAEVLLYVAQEARLLSRKAAGLDAELSKAVAHAEFPVRAELQMTDLLRQELEGLEQFITALAGTLDADGHCLPCDAARHLSIRAQAARLGKINAAESPPPNGISELWEG